MSEGNALRESDSECTLPLGCIWKDRSISSKDAYVSTKCVFRHRTQVKHVIMMYRSIMIFLLSLCLPSREGHNARAQAHLGSFFLFSVRISLSVALSSCRLILFGEEISRCRTIREHSRALSPLPQRYELRYRKMTKAMTEQQ